MPDHSTDAASALTRAQLRSRAVAEDAAAEGEGGVVSSHSARPTIGERDDRSTSEGEAVPPVEPGAERRGGTHRRPRRTDWRLGGRTVLRWREWLLAFALISVGLGVVAGSVVVWLWPSPWAATLATALLWLGMLVPIVGAFIRSRPIGLLRARPVDVLYAVVIGALLRLVQGWMQLAVGGSDALPSYPTLDRQLSSGWWFTELVSPVVVAPVLEEFFFRAVILVALYSALRKPVGRLTAGLVAVLVSTGMFVLLHAVGGTLSVDEALSLTLIGLVCALLVTLTGRIWGAVLVHVVYNATFVILALAGTFLT